MKHVHHTRLNVLKEIICFLALIYFYGRSSEIKIMVIAVERRRQCAFDFGFESLAYRLLLIWIIISNLCKPPKVILMVMPQANSKLNNNIQSTSTMCHGLFSWGIYYVQSSIQDSIYSTYAYQNQRSIPFLVITIANILQILNLTYLFLLH